jgi:hypothetical protein
MIVLAPKNSPEKSIALHHYTFYRVALLCLVASCFGERTTIMLRLLLLLVLDTRVWGD